MNVIKLFKKQWAVYSAILVFVFLSAICKFDPFGLETNFFGSESRTPAKTLTYIGAISGAILVLGNLYASNKRNILTEKGQLDNRFKDAAQLLASSDTSAILSGMYALHQIAIECSNSEDGSYKGYIKIIHNILCAYVRENWRNPEENEETIKYKPLIILQTILNLLSNKENIYNDCIIDLNNTNLSGISLEGENLVGANYLKRIEFDGINFTKANLSGANFSGAKLSRTGFIGTDLSPADFEEANLKTIEFDGINFSGANISGANFSEAKLEKANFSGADLTMTNFSGARLENVNFSGANISGANFSGADLTMTNFSGADITFTFLYMTNLSNTVLEGYSIEEITRPGRSLELTTAEAVAVWEEEQRKKKEEEFKQLF